MYTYIPSYLDFLPIQVTTEHWVEFPVPDSGSHQFSVSYRAIYRCQFQPPNSSHHSLHPQVSIRLFATSVSLFLPCKSVPFLQISTICINIQYFSLSDLLYSVRQSLGPPTSLQMQFHFFYWVSISPLYVPHLYPFFC